jgi:hypothetical protein
MANLNIAAKASASAQAQVLPVGSASMCRLRREPCTKSLSDSTSVEAVITLPTMKCSCTHTVSNHHIPVMLCVLPHRKGKQHHVYTPTTSPRKKRQHVPRAAHPQTSANHTTLMTKWILLSMCRAVYQRPSLSHSLNTSPAVQASSTPCRPHHL